MEDDSFVKFRLADNVIVVNKDHPFVEEHGTTKAEKELLRTGERIQTLRHAFNTREGLRPSEFKPHPRMTGAGDGKLAKGPLAGIEVDQMRLVKDYYQAMGWDYETGAVRPEKLQELGLQQLVH